MSLLDVLLSAFLVAAAYAGATFGFLGLFVSLILGFVGFHAVHVVLHRYLLFRAKQPRVGNSQETTLATECVGQDLSCEFCFALYVRGYAHAHTVASYWIVTEHLRSMSRWTTMGLSILSAVVFVSGLFAFWKMFLSKRRMPNGGSHLTTRARQEILVCSGLLFGLSLWAALCIFTPIWLAP